MQNEQQKKHVQTLQAELLRLERMLVTAVAEEICSLWSRISDVRTEIDSLDDEDDKSLVS